MRRLLIVAGLIVAAVSVGSPARAAENGEWALNPSNYEGADERTFFSYDVRPGQRLVDSVTLTNYSDTPITLELAAVDAYNTADEGAFALRKPDDEPPQDLGAWVRLPVDRWTVAPRSSTDFDFELVVPEGVRPGDHAGGILSLAITASESDEAEGVAVRKGVGVRIYARVLGDIAPAILVDQVRTSHGTPWAPFTTSDATVSFRITNTGNLVVAPNIHLEADSPFGSLDSADLGPMQELLPGNSIVVTHHWSGVPAGGPVKQRVIVNGEGYEFTSSSTFWMIPWWLIPVVTGVVVLARWLRRRLPRRAATAIAGATLLIALLALPARAAESPQLMLATNATAVGETMRVSGRGWDPRSNVVVELCSNLAIEGSVDCDIRGSRVVAVGPDGRFAAKLVVGALPAPCPCVIRVRAVSGREQVVASVDVDGVASVPVPSAAPGGRSRSGSRPGRRPRASCAPPFTWVVGGAPRRSECPLLCARADRTTFRSRFRGPVDSRHLVQYARNRWSPVCLAR